MDNIYRNPSPLQFEGPRENEKTITLSVEDQDYIGWIQQLRSYLDKVRDIGKSLRCRRDLVHGVDEDEEYCRGFRGNI